MGERRGEGGERERGRKPGREGGREIEEELQAGRERKENYN